VPVSRIFGAALFAVGAVLLIFAYNASNAPVDRVVDTFTGHYTHQTMVYLALGVCGVVAGGLLVLVGRRG
jgi:drug/metabolite transporter (DMT)-like permease